MTPSSSVQVDTAVGPAGLVIDDAADPWARLLLGHGAGGGVQARDLSALATTLPDAGVSVIRVEQPWRLAGKRVASPPPVLDRAWSAVVETLPRDLPLVFGGRSAGARVACRTAAALGASGVVALAFPLHPPGRPERSRLAELVDAGVPALVVQGDRDPFGRPEEFPVGPYDLLVVAGGDHGMSVPRSVSLAEALDTLAAGVQTWLERLLAR